MLFNCIIFINNDNECTDNSNKSLEDICEVI